jgi:hypothetical protein
MTFKRKIPLILFVAAAAACMHFPANAQPCAPPHGFVDRQPPAIASPVQLVAHIEEIVVDRSLAAVQSADQKSLKDTIKKASSLPGVSGDYPLNSIPFGTPGARRLVCLTDGSTLEEQVLARERTDATYHFRYEVWNYTSSAARPIEYGVGEFHYTQSDPAHTHILWTYSFKLKDNEFPGYLGALGRYMFRVFFLDRQYAEMMRGTLQAGKQNAESQPWAQK